MERRRSERFGCGGACASRTVVMVVVIDVIVFQRGPHVMMVPNLRLAEVMLAANQPLAPHF